MVVGQIRESRNENAGFWSGSRSEVPRYPRRISDLKGLWTNKRSSFLMGDTCQQQVTAFGLFGILTAVENICSARSQNQCDAFVYPWIVYYRSFRIVSDVFVVSGHSLLSVQSESTLSQWFHRTYTIIYVTAVTFL